MDDLIGLVIQSEEDGSTYQILHQIGSWGPDYQFNVYECLVGHINVPNMALKVLPRAAGGEPMWQAANVEVTEMLDCFINPGIETNVLLFRQQFITHINNLEYLCIVFAYRQTISTRRIVLTDQRFRSGFTIPCIRRALCNLVSGVADLHHFRLAHGQLTAGHLLCTEQNIVLGALCTAFEQDLQDLPALAPQFMPLNRISNWGRAPEYDADVGEEEEQAAQPPLEVQEAIAAEGDIVFQVEEWEWVYRERRDVWSIGVVALELGYGQLRVVDRAQFLTAVSFIEQQGIMPNTWDQVVENSAAQIPIYPNAGRFTGSYIEFVRACLRANPNERPGIQQVQSSNFLKPHRMITAKLVYYQRSVLSGSNHQSLAESMDQWNQPFKS